MSDSNFKALKVALAGNPNSGKTSLFNVLTGASQHVGNYPGVTVEKRWGEFENKGQAIHVVDLPGTYNLSSFSPEERVARDELIGGAHDITILVVDSSALERSLMLLVQIMQLGKKTILCLNMADEAMASGQKIDIQKLENRLGFPVVETEANTGKGREALILAILKVGQKDNIAPPPLLGKDLDEVTALLSSKLDLPSPYHKAKDWIALRLLLNDLLFIKELEQELGQNILNKELSDIAQHQRSMLEEKSGEPIDLCLAQARASFTEDLLKEVVTSEARKDANKKSESIDKILVHPRLGLPIFALFMYGVFWMTFTLGEYPMGWIEQGFDLLGQWVESFWPANSDSELRSLLVSGIIAGVGGVVVFLPNIMLLFFGLAILEDTGYMARAAFLMDRAMNRFGLHGKSFVPMLSGFGCSIPGIMATRTLENERDRLTTMMVLPLMSCGARLTIWMLLIPAFFAPSWRAPALWIIYSIGIGMALLIALLLRKSIFKGEEAPFVMELPPYRLPTAKALFKKMSERAWIYLRKAGTVILGVSVLLWFLSNYPKKEHFDIDAQVSSGSIELVESEINSAKENEALRYSVAGRVGTAMEPVIAPMGFDWKLGISMLGAFAAKEVFVAQMGIVYSMGEVDEENTDLRDHLSRDYSPLVGFSLILFLLISTPCLATFAVTKRESGSWKWAFLQLGGLTGVGYLVSTLVYQIGSLF